MSALHFNWDLGGMRVVVKDKIEFSFGIGLGSVFVNGVGVETMNHYKFIKNNKLTVCPRLQLGFGWSEGWD